MLEIKTARYSARTAMWEAGWALVHLTKKGGYEDHLNDMQRLFSIRKLLCCNFICFRF